ncbi:hypothetical protein GALMADRAFT_75463, partial [Galerina marginata CBS 339.88]
RNTYCEGGHDLSIGSLGKAVLLLRSKTSHESILMNNTLYGARFKSWTGGNGLARKYLLGSMSTSTYPFSCNHQLTGELQVGPRPNTTSTNKTHIQDISFQNFAGVVKEFVISYLF